MWKRSEPDRAETVVVVVVVVGVKAKLIERLVRQAMAHEVVTSRINPKNPLTQITPTTQTTLGIREKMVLVVNNNNSQTLTILSMELTRIIIPIEIETEEGMVTETKATITIIIIIIIIEDLRINRFYFFDCALFYSLSLCPFFFFCWWVKLAHTHAFTISIRHFALYLASCDKIFFYISINLSIIVRKANCDKNRTL
jgi:hypothetical protein